MGRLSTTECTYLPTLPVGGDGSGGGSNNINKNDCSFFIWVGVG